MSGSTKSVVTITAHGRSGQVVYREAGGELSFDWELGGGDVVASVRVGTEAEWRAMHGWAAGRRAEILRVVAAEVIRQRAPACTASVDADAGWMHFRGPHAAPPAPPMPITPDVAFVRRFTRLKARLSVIGDAAYLNAAFLRLDDRSEPVRVRNPDGALMIYTSEPGRKGTLRVARVDTEGTIIWNADTRLDRFALQQILPGEQSMAFIGTRPRVPDQVPEPLLVIVDNASGAMTTHSLWR